MEDFIAAGVTTLLVLTAMLILSNYWKREWTRLHDSYVKMNKELAELADVGKFTVEYKRIQDILIGAMRINMMRGSPYPGHEEFDAEIDRILGTDEGRGPPMVLVPVEPTRGLLISMALRDDHAFGMPYNSDAIMTGLTDKEKEARLRSMASLHEEVVGAGFYRPHKEQSYREMAPATEEKPD